jgi:hypothetical protein
MRFKKNFIELILAGKKTTTLRRDDRRFTEDDMTHIVTNKEFL